MHLHDTSTIARNSADIVIIGGGVIGLTIARALARRGVRDICLIEHNNLGTESSFAAAGMLAPQAEADSRDDFFDLLCQSRDMYASFAESLKDETGVDIELDTTGTLYLAFSEHDQQEIDKRFEWQTRAGLPVEKLTCGEARLLEHFISPNVSGALRFPNDIQVENRRLLSALSNSISQLEVQIRNWVHVEKVRTEKNRVVGVETDAGFIGCSTVVVSAGAWTSFVDSKVRIEPVRGQMVCFSPKRLLAQHVIYSPRGYIVPRQDRRLLAGSTSEAVGFAKEVTPDGVATILRNTNEISPLIATQRIADTWAGLRPRSADGLPVLGPCGEIDGLVFATGHYRNGILLAPVTGELIANAIVEGFVPRELAPFSPDRFATVSI